MKPETIFFPATWQDPNDKAPDFVKGELNIKPKEMIEWLQTVASQHTSAKGWIKVKMLVSRKGSIYFALDTWKPTPKTEEETFEKEVPENTKTSVGVNGEIYDTSEIPF